MQEDGVTGPRTVLPRWRSLARTPAFELQSTFGRRQNLISSNRVSGREIARWNASGTLENAADVIDSAFISGDYISAQGAARQILMPDSTAVSPLKEAASQIIGKLSDRPISVIPQSEENITEKIYAGIRTLKFRLIDMPRDSITSIELARLHALIGQISKASSYIERSIGLNPENRYVLRSSARFFTHIGDIERAYETLSRTDAVKSDPWIQAAEAATADLCDRIPAWAVKQRRKLLERKSIDIKYSELASGLATFELNRGGSQKEIRKLVNVSLRSPTENSLAQAQWMKERGHILEPPNPNLLKMSLANEARTHAAYEAEDYSEAAKQAYHWLLDEPLSDAAALAGSYFCIAYLSKYKEAVRFADVGLRSRPNDPSLVNNKLVALARDGDLEAARDLLPALEVVRSDNPGLPYLYAAKGLISFKDGNVSEGRTFYEKAVNSAKEAGDKTLAANALLNWLAEEASARSMPKEEIDVVLNAIKEAAEKGGSNFKKDVNRSILQHRVLTEPDQNIKNINVRTVRIPTKNKNQFKDISYYISN